MHIDSQMFLQKEVANTSTTKLTKNVFSSENLSPVSKFWYVTTGKFANFPILLQGLAKTGKKGVKKKIIDPFTRKDWYDIKAPSVFKVRDVGKTLVNRTAGTKLASDGLKGRVYEVSLADLQNETVRLLLSYINGLK